MAHRATGGLDDGIDVVDVDEAVAVGARHLIVDLGDHEMCALGGGQGGVDADAEAAEAVRIGRRNLDQGDIEGHGSAFEQVFNLAEIDGRVIGAAIVDGVANIAADKDRVMAEVPGHLGSDVGRGAHASSCGRFPRPRQRERAHEGFDQRLGLGASGLDVDAHAGWDAAQGFIGGAQFLSCIQFPRTFDLPFVLT